MRPHKCYLLLGILLLGPGTLKVFAQPDVCGILAANLTPDTFVQGTDSERFKQAQKLVSDNIYEKFDDAQKTDFNGTLLSEYVDIFVNSKSDGDNWSEHRRQFLNQSSDAASSRASNNVKITKWNEGVLQKVVDCQKVYADLHGFSVVLKQVSPNRDSFAVLLTNSTLGNPKWKLTDFSVKPTDLNFHCSNGFESASDVNSIPLKTQAILVVCSKSRGTHLILGIQTSAGPARDAIPLDSIDEHITKMKADIDAKIALLSTRLDNLDKPGIVAAFNMADCPTPWQPYLPAEGRFIRGYDPQAHNDPDGVLRQIGSVQADGIGSHVHAMGANGADSTTMVNGRERLANFVGDLGSGGKKQTDANDGAIAETRPKNVALRYCILK